MGFYLPVYADNKIPKKDARMIDDNPLAKAVVIVATKDISLASQIFVGAKFLKLSRYQNDHDIDNPEEEYFIISDFKAGFELFVKTYRYLIDNNLFSHHVYENELNKAVLYMTRNRRKFFITDYQELITAPTHIPPGKIEQAYMKYVNFTVNGINKLKVALDRQDDAAVSNAVLKAVWEIEHTIRLWDFGPWPRR